MAKIHIHTKYSLLDSIIKPEELVKKVKEQDGDNAALCVTEHGNMYSNVELYKLCKEYDVKYMLGCEAYICDDVNIKDKNSKYSHLVVIAKNEEGRINLNKLVSESCHHKYYGKPRIDFDMLCKYKEGLIVTSACMAGEIQRLIVKEDYNKIEEIITRYKAEFGDDYYLEYQSHSGDVQQFLNRKIVDLANKYNIKYIVTTDAHYLNKEDKKYHDIFVQIGNAREVGETYLDCYVQSNEEILEICKSTTREENLIALQNADEIANKCNVELPLSPPIMPHVPIPSEYNSEMDYLRKLCDDGWESKGISKKDNSEEYKKRLEYELDAIEKMGFEGYFLLVHSYCNSVIRRGIARGSAGGSLVCYLSNITDIDPIEYGLYFERFIDVGALELLEKGLITPNELKIPDVDSDFGKKDRGKVLQYVIDRYGEEKVVSLGSFQYIWAKGAIKDIGKVLGLPFELTNQITASLGDETIDEAIELGLLDEFKDSYQELFGYVKRLAGLPKSFSAHACGKVIAMNDVTYYNATDINDEGLVILQGDMHTADDLGLIKADFLGLRTVDIIYDTLDAIGKDYNYIAPHNLNMEDDKVFNEFRNGNTAGIFQFESTGMQSTLKQINCSSMNDLAIANALYRPGSLKYIENYANRRLGIEKFEYLHPDLEPILSNSYGIIVFQEQLIEIGRLAKLTNPDELRKATGKKKPELLQKVKPELFAGLSARGWSDEQLNELWDIMLDFAKYSFNKSHAAAYAIIAYICMYLKTYHTKEFLCSWLNSLTDPKKIPECIDEIKRLNIPLYIGKYDNCSDVCQLYEDGLIIGVGMIKFCNTQIADDLMRITKDKSYDSFIDLLIDIKQNTTFNSKQLDILTKLDFFSEFGSIGKLLAITEYFSLLYGKKQMNKVKAEELGLTELLSKYSGKETEKMYSQIDSLRLLTDICNTVSEKKITVGDIVKWQQEYLGYIDYKNDKLPKTNIIVTGLNTKYSPRFNAYCLNNGKIMELKVSNASNPKSPVDTFKKKPFENGDILDIVKCTKKPKVKKTADGWETIPNEFNWWLDKYNIISLEG